MFPVNEIICTVVGFLFGFLIFSILYSGKDGGDSNPGGNGNYLYS